MITPRRGDVWLATFDPVIGHEQGGTRPCVIVSSDAYNRQVLGMIIVVPLTTRDRGLAHQPPIRSENAGLSKTSFARPEDVRSMSRRRLLKRLGQTTDEELLVIGRFLRSFIGLRL